MAEHDPIRLSWTLHKYHLAMTAFPDCGRNAIAFIRRNGWKPKILHQATHCSPFPTSTNGAHTLGWAFSPPLAISAASARRSASARPMDGKTALSASDDDTARLSSNKV